MCSASGVIRPHTTQTTNEMAAQQPSDQPTIFQFNIGLASVVIVMIVRFPSLLVRAVVAMVAMAVKQVYADAQQQDNQEEGVRT